MVSQVANEGRGGCWLGFGSVDAELTLTAAPMPVSTEPTTINCTARSSRFRRCTSVKLRPSRCSMALSASPVKPRPASARKARRVGRDGEGFFDSGSTSHRIVMKSL